MNAPHVTALLVAPAPGTPAARGAPAGAAFLPAAAADEPVDFAQLVADSLPQELVEAAVPDQGGKREGQPKQDEAKEPSTDPLQFLGLPVAVAPMPAPPEAGPGSDQRPGAILAPAPAPAVAAPGPASAGKSRQDPEAPVLDAKAVQAEKPAPEAAPPMLAKKEAPPAPGADEARVLAQAGEAQRAQAGALARTPLPVAAPVGTREWREEFSAAVRVIATEKIQSAEIHLNPPELGPVHVSLRVEAKEATVAFAAPHADTRQALQEALPRLRELLQADGLSLGSVSVDLAGAGGFAHAQDQAEQRLQAFAVPAAAPSNGAAEPQAAPAAPPARSPRLVDTFA